MSETQQTMDPNNDPVASHVTGHLEILKMVSNVVAAYVSNNTVEISDLPEFIKHVHRGLLCSNDRSSFSLPKPTNPAVPIEESITPDYVVCLEDGRRMKMLKRHLKTAYNMTPDRYRERWGLPANYPMVAPNYAKKRQGIAKNIGLGKSRKKAA